MDEKKNNRCRQARYALFHPYLRIMMLAGMVYLCGCSPQPDVNVDVPICAIDQPLSPSCRRAPQVYDPDAVPFPDMEK